MEKPVKFSIQKVADFLGHFLEDEPLPHHIFSCTKIAVTLVVWLNGIGASSQTPQKMWLASGTGIQPRKQRNRTFTINHLTRKILLGLLRENSLRATVCFFTKVPTNKAGWAMGANCFFSQLTNPHLPPRLFWHEVDVGWFFFSLWLVSHTSW